MIDAFRPFGDVELDVAVRVRPLERLDGAFQGVGLVVIEDRERVVRGRRENRAGEQQTGDEAKAALHGIES